jgi:hypothetical protein
MRWGHEDLHGKHRGCGITGWGKSSKIVVKEIVAEMGPSRGPIFLVVLISHDHLIPTKVSARWVSWNLFVF